MAYYFSLMIAQQDFPVLIGPYRDWDDCASVREWVSRHFENDTSACGLLPFPQEDSVLMQVFDYPPAVAYEPLDGLSGSGPLERAGRF